MINVLLSKISPLGYVCIFLFLIVSYQKYENHSLSDDLRSAQNTEIRLNDEIVSLKNRNDFLYNELINQPEIITDISKNVCKEIERGDKLSDKIENLKIKTAPVEQEKQLGGSNEVDIDTRLPDDLIRLLNEN